MNISITNSRRFDNMPCGDIIKNGKVTDMNNSNDYNKTVPPVYAPEEFCERAQALAEKLKTEFVSEKPQTLFLCVDKNGLSLAEGEAAVSVDFSKLIRRIKHSNPFGEMVVKAAKIKGNENPNLIDATAGLGEDSFILAAAGFNVTLCEYNPVICALLEDGIEKAKSIPPLSEAAGRMTVYEGDSIEYMASLTATPDVVLLDPMFPERQKSALTKKKFQLIHRLEKPCDDEETLLDAAIRLRPHKIVIKRPIKGAYLAGRKPDYSLDGKAIRYDCFVFAKE